MSYLVGPVRTKSQIVAELDHATRTHDVGTKGRPSNCMIKFQGTSGIPEELQTKSSSHQGHLSVPFQNDHDETGFYGGSSSGAILHELESHICGEWTDTRD